MAVKIARKGVAKSFKSSGKTNLLVPIIDNVIGKGDFVWDFTYEPKETDDAWHPSTHATQSLLELYNSVKDPSENKPSISLYKAFIVGHFWHQYLQWVISNYTDVAGPDDIERSSYKGWGDKDGDNYKPFHWVKGSGDIVPAKIGDSEFLVDIKTMNSHDFANKELPRWCADKYTCQANIYMDLFDQENSIILAVQKDSPHDMKEFHIKRNQKLIDAIYSKWELVSECLNHDVEPPKDEEIELPL